MSENEIAGFQYAEGSPACTYTYKRTIIHKNDEIQHHYHNGIGDYVRFCNAAPIGRGASFKG